MRRSAITLILLFLLSTLAPLTVATIETQFSDGTTNFTHTFSQSGDASTPGITLPYGAEVTSAQFTIKGEPSTTEYANATTNTHFGGPTTTDGSMSIPWFSGSYRTGIDVDNDQASLRPQQTTQYWTLQNSNQISASSGGTLNTTGGHYSSAEAGLIGATNTRQLTMGTGGTWNYAGPLVKQSDEYHILEYSSSSHNAISRIARYNASTHAYIGLATINYGSCTTSVTGYVNDATSDGNGSVWTVSYSYRFIAKWTINGGAWSCQQYWTMPSSGSTRYPSGIAFDPQDGEMYLLSSYYNSPNYVVDMWRVNRTAPTSALASWTLNTIPSGKGVPAGLDVEMPRITYNVFCTYSSSTNCDARSKHVVFHDSPTWPIHQGDILFPNTAHYGIERIDDGEIGFTCFYTNYCGTSQSRIVHVNGASAATWIGTPSSVTSTITSSTSTLARTVTELTLGSAFTWEPSGTSIEFMVTNDGGATWKRATVGSVVTFANAGSQIAWKAWLNGTTSVTPILDSVGLSYTATYLSSGHMRMYRYSFAGTMPIAATVWWNASTPGGSSVTVYWRTGTSVCGTSTHAVPTSGTTVSFTGTPTYLTLCIYLYAGSNNQFSPTVLDFNMSAYSNAPQNVKLDIGDDGTNEWSYTGTLIGTTSASSGSAGGSTLDDAINNEIPGTGSGTVTVPLTVKSSAAGYVEIVSFNIEYTMQTVNLDINFDEDMVLHERNTPYEVVTRHVIGDTALAITSAQLSFIAAPSSDAPGLTWTDDGSLVDDDPEDWIMPNQAGTWTNNSNGIFEIHWSFRITADFPEQNNVGFRVSSTDDNGRTPVILSTGPAGIRVNQSYGLGWLALRDVEGEVTNNDVQSGDWVSAGETVHFQGQIWFDGTEDAPLNSMFDVRVARKDSQGDYSGATWKDQSNPDGAFFISVEVPDFDAPDGVTFEIQTYNERDPTKVMPTNDSWRRTIRVDATSPAIVYSWPLEGGYEASSSEQQIVINVDDAVGSPEQLKLFYWVEADHDTNRNGAADDGEYVNKTLTNMTDAEHKIFTSTIDDSRNPNMARVSYYISGTDPSGNSFTSPDGPGFGYDLATYQTRKDMQSVFTGVTWYGHTDGNSVFSGVDQTISVGLVDANGVIDFEYITLIFDFEGPDPTRDQQKISFSGRNGSFWSEGPYINLQPSSHTMVTTNDTGLPWIMASFNFQFSWDWPDEDISDLALEYKELGYAEPTTFEFIEHTFRVENDLVLDASTYLVEDVAEPRLGPVDDATPVRPDDRLRWSGHVVYEGSQAPAPSNLGITVEVFDGVQYWSDGSLGTDGGFSIEVPLSAAPTLQSAETRTFLTGIRNVPGRGEDMTRDTVATTLQLQVDHTPPRVHYRIEPIDVIDISARSDLSAVPVAFHGWEECVLEEGEDRCAAFTQSPQWVNWVMRDEARTIAAGRSPLATQVLESGIEWIGDVDLTSGGVVTPRSGYRIGFWVTGHDAAGNEFPMSGNTESDPVREPAELDGDYDLAWVRLGATVAELYVKSVAVDNDVVGLGKEIEVTATIANSGGMTESSFSVVFIAGDEIIKTERVSLMPSGSEHVIVATWKAEEGVDRITVIVDVENEVVEVDEEGNSMSVGVAVDYAWGLGWLDAWRRNPLTVISIIIALIVLPVIGFITWKTAVATGSALLEDELMYEDEDDDWEDEDDDYDEEGWE